MSNLLLITDVARLRKVFGRLTEDKNIRLRVVNNLEKGGEELTIEKPDVVFVQTHLSGLSADILIMHLKKQLGRKRSRFVLLASPSQTSASILKPYQGWLDTSAEDGLLLSELQKLLVTLLSKPKKSEGTVAVEPASAIETEKTSATVEPAPKTVTAPPVSVTDSLPQAGTATQLPSVTSFTTEPSLEEQGITYAPRQRLKVYSEFNSSFDNAVSSTPEPETIEQATPSLSRNWSTESIDTIDTIETGPTRSKRVSFLLWLTPVVIAVVVITYLQQRTPAKTAAEPEVAVTTPAVQTKDPLLAPVKTPAAITAIPPAAPKAPEQDKMSDKAVLNAIAENRSSKSQPPAVSSGASLTSLPDFIPRYGFDKHYGAANPGWERYKGQVTEFKLLREAQKIKVIQVIDRGGNGVPESFMKAVLHQVTKKPLVSIELSEKKDGYEIQRGSITGDIKAVYYRDENGGKLRAFVLTWQ